MTPQPKDIYYHPNKPACLKHGWGHWTKDCTELQAQSPVSSEPTHSDIMAMMAAVQKYWVTASGEPELWGFAKYVLGLVASETTKANKALLDNIGEPKLGDFDIKPESYDDVIKAIKWYKDRINKLIKEYE